ncbi:hypothetical protein I3843_01G182800 [Carya illinoinensis]|nr:hypothetical protein I3843_01G182800 [Carya illinoinensis]
MQLAVARRFHRPRSKPDRDENVIPRLERTECSRVGKLERFSHYVARQMGFLDANECPQLCKLAYDYLRKSKGCDDSIYEFVANEPDAQSLCLKLIEEFEKCILSYFAFHWGQASLLISQVLSVESEQKIAKLKDVLLAATRKQRFERVTKNLKVTRTFTTLVEEMKAIGTCAHRGDESQCTEVMVPAAHNERSPVLLLMGGSMGAGKSTVLKDILRVVIFGIVKMGKEEEDASRITPPITNPSTPDISRPLYSGVSNYMPSYYCLMPHAWLPPFMPHSSSNPYPWTN